MKSWQVGNPILPYQPNGETTFMWYVDNLILTILPKKTNWVTANNPMKSTMDVYLVLLSQTVAHLLCNVLKKIINPSNISLFKLLPPHILSDIDTWICGLKCHNKFKPVQSWFKNMKNTVLNTISTKCSTLYHNFDPFIIYSATLYDWLHICIKIFPEGSWPYLEKCTDISYYITQLTHQILLQYKLNVELQQLSQNTNL